MTKRRAATDRARVAAGLRRELRDKRKAAGMTQQDVAKKAGISAEFYSRIERTAALPSLPLLLRLRAVLGIDVSKIFSPTE